MKRSAFLGSVLVFTLLLSSCEKKAVEEVSSDPITIELSAKAKDFVGENNSFGIDLFTAVVKNEGQKNLMLSPLSANIALNMLQNGTKGETHAQIKKMLGYESSLSQSEINATYLSLVEQLLKADPKVEFTLANAVFYKNGFPFQQSYLDLMKSAYKAQVQGLEFPSEAALKTINQWASDNTNGKIDKVLDRISPNAAMFLMNALYFKGDWIQQFDSKNTIDQKFRLENGTLTDVPTMTGEVPVKIHRTAGYTAFEMGYGRRNFVMDILEPNNALSEFVLNFKSTDWQELTGNMDAQEGESETKIILPKFSYKYSKELNDQLKALGMIDAFDESKADLTGIGEGLFVSFVKQDTFVDVNEEGTEAAAVTTVGVIFTSAGGPPVIRVDKPFMFAIREVTSNTLLFIGTVYNPLSK